MHPLKVPANYEPVILKNTTMVVGVAGIDSLFKSINKFVIDQSKYARFKKL